MPSLLLNLHTRQKECDKEVPDVEVTTLFHLEQELQRGLYLPWQALTFARGIVQHFAASNAQLP